MARERFNPQAMMTKAIEVMLQSVAEPRADSKATPKVGAVLIPTTEVVTAVNNTLPTASRGELREGDHAEFTLLERKCRHCRLDGCVLFATLEPCAPGSRRHPKLACSERIVLARIKEVWVGIEDPDPTVDRKGIKYLQDNGVTVRMFDREFQDQIREANKEFIEQALQRAAAAQEEEHKTKTVILSKFENPVLATLDDFDSASLEQFRTKAKIDVPVEAPEFHRRLQQQGLLKDSGGALVPSGFGLLLFGKEPRAAIPQAGLLATIHYPGGTEEARDFVGPMVSIPGDVERWLADKLPNTIDRSHAERQDAPALPYTLVREAVVNALVHRDYDVTGAKCQLIVTADTITVKSPGGPLSPITLEQLQSFAAPMLSRNPELHYVFSRMALAEERGLGMKTFRSSAQDLGLPPPKYTYEAPYLVLTLYRSREAAVQTLPARVLADLSPDEQTGWTSLLALDTITKATYAEATGYDERKALRHLKHFTDLKLLERHGKGPATTYVVRK